MKLFIYRLRRKLRTYLGYRIIYSLFWIITRTVRLRVIGEDILDSLKAAGKGFILVSWHGKTLLPIYYVGRRGYWAIISPSRDGDIQNLMVTKNGFRTIRGSSGKRGVRALVESIRKLTEGDVLTITPDGPKGPPNEVQLGTVHMAHKSGCPVIPIGVAASPRRLVGSWDSYMIPMPFARGVIYMGEPVRVGAPGDGEDQDIWLKQQADRIKKAIDDADDRAEAELALALKGQLAET
jgi:lysophospholipid acyltransferase (LPLAT)-like uncharacterized protein